jgi:hypothetical protein
MRKNSLVETFSNAYAAACPDEQAALRVWMRDIILPRKEGRNDLAGDVESFMSSWCREGRCARRRA